MQVFSGRSIQPSTFSSLKTPLRSLYVPLTQLYALKRRTRRHDPRALKLGLGERWVSSSVLGGWAKSEQLAHKPRFAISAVRLSSP